MTNAQRSSSALNTGQLVWGGTSVKNGAPLFLGPATVVRIDTPAAIAGEKDFGTAGFGGQPPNPPLQAQVVLANDGVEGLLARRVSGAHVETVPCTELRAGDRLVIEPVRKRGLITLLKTMKPLDEDFPEINDQPVQPEEIF